MRLRNFFPRTLFNRLLIIILLPLLVVQLLTVTVFYVRHWNTVTRHMAQNLVADLSAVISQIEDKNNPINSKLINLSQKLNLIISWEKEKEIPQFEEWTLVNEINVRPHRLYVRSRCCDDCCCC